MHLAHKKNNRNDKYQLFSNDNPLLRRRKSQDGEDNLVDKKVPLDFQDLFELKQKLIVPHAKKSNDNVHDFLFDSKEKLSNVKRTPSPSKNITKK